MRAIARRAHRRTISSGVPGVCCVRVQGKGQRIPESQQRVARPIQFRLLIHVLQKEWASGWFGVCVCIGAVGTQGEM